MAGKRRIANLVLPARTSVGDLTPDQLRQALGLRPEALVDETLADALAHDQADTYRNIDEGGRHERAATAPPRESTGDVAAFWADNGYEPGPIPQIRPTPDPGALPRSLGNPPLAPAVSQHHLDAVYEEAVRAATALAAANGLVTEGVTSEA